MVILSVKDLSVKCKTLKNQLSSHFSIKKFMQLQKLMKVLLMFQSGFFLHGTCFYYRSSRNLPRSPSRHWRPCQDRWRHLYLTLSTVRNSSKVGYSVFFGPEDRLQIVACKGLKSMDHVSVS